MSREWPSDAESSLVFSLSAGSPRFFLSTFSRQRVALSIVEMRALDGWAALPRQAADAGAAAIAIAAAVSSAIPTPRIHGRVEMGSGRARGAGLELELQAL